MAIHPLAVVDPQAQIHPDAVVGPFCVVGAGTTLEAGCELRSHVSVCGRTTIGRGTIIFPGASVGTDPQDLKYRGEDSRCLIGADCRIHECVTISKGTAGGGMETVVGDGCLVMAYAHIAHDCVLDRNIVVGNNAQLAGHVRVGRKAWIAGLVGIHHFVSIGELAMVGGMSGVRFDAPPFLTVEGYPAEPRNVNIVGMRRDGWSDDEVRNAKDAFRRLYHDRGATPLAQAADEVLHSALAEQSQAVQRLCTWIIEHLSTAIKGRVQEAFR
jgi:UDP-N-acetylglucosamine acyltransferase